MSKTLKEAMNALMKPALQEAKYGRGHFMDGFSQVGDSKRKQVASCRHCGAEIHVDYQKPKGDEVWGDALTNNCASKDLLEGAVGGE